MLTPVILCGGSGTRLWPLSRSTYPKQFVDLGDGKTLFKETILRAQIVTNGGIPLVVTSDLHRFYAQANLFECGQKATIIVEPIPRNTAPAIAAAAMVAIKEDENAILLVMPSDHAIENSEKFKNAIEKGYKLAEKGYLVTFGIKPNAPETGFGYIEPGNEIENLGYVINRFVEKPKREIAKELFESGRYYWNSGIFMFKASNYLEELDKYNSAIAGTVREAVYKAKICESVISLQEKAFIETESISIDYAVMERTTRAVVVPMETKWTDLGSWESFYDFKTKDIEGNVVEGDVISLNTKNCYINSRNRLIATIGLKDLAIVETNDAVLVASLNQTQDVRQIVKQLKGQKRAESEINPLVYRPWGSYEALSKGERFQVKRIIVRPGEELSLQKHYHRAEHWIVVQGSAEIVLGKTSIFLTENQSTYIPVGEIHKLKNPGKVPLIVIEVQSGSYLGEDDIVRLEDKYHRQ